MHLHYFTLERQVNYLRSKILNLTIAESYSQRKNEWIIGLTAQGQGRGFLQLSSDAQNPYILWMESNHRNKASADVMEELISSQIAAIVLLPGERIIQIGFKETPHRLLLQFFTARTNFFLVNDQGQILNAFKGQRKFAGTIFEIPANSQEDFENLLPDEIAKKNQEKPEINLTSFLKQFSYMTRPVVQEILFRCNLAGNLPLHQLSETTITEMQQTAKTFFDACRTQPPRIYFQREIPERFALGELQHLQNESSEEFDNINRALRFFNFQVLKYRGLIQRKTQFSNTLHKKIKSLQFNLKNVEARPANPGKAEYFQKIGQLIASQPHLIKPGETSIELVDYYDPKMPTLNVDIKPELPAQENAEIYFRKARKFSEKADQHKQQQENLRKQLKQYSELLETLEGVDHPKKLDKIEQQLKAQHVLQHKAHEAEKFRCPYKTYQHKNFQIWVGRSARDNDELTFKHANKSDVWLHVQSASGSHVVIRNPRRLEQIPKETLEYAARLAVTNSTAKHASYVPVLYTFVKHVRKPRKSPPGTVLPAQTKTIFVDPL